MNSKNHTLMVSTLKGIRGDRPPIWFMRQAGRTLPEYRELRKKYSMLELISNSELVTKVTMQPVTRFNPDAAIIFADILNCLIDAGFPLEFIEGVGPKFISPIRNPSDVLRLKPIDPYVSVKYTLDAINTLNQTLTIPVIGFAGAPFTLSYYLIEGSGAKNPDKLKCFFSNYPDEWSELQKRLIQLLVNYLVAQANSGAAALQVFDSWVGVASPYQFKSFILPWLQLLFNELKAKTDVPLIYFPFGGTHLIPWLNDCPIDVIGIDWRNSLSQVKILTNDKIPLQGNLDPQLFTGSWSLIESETLSILAEGSKLSHGHIFNLGHGLLPNSELSNIEQVFNLVKNYRYS
jgi:uroporphyrinogen decarboxylase